MWADTAYRSQANEKHLADNGPRSRIHRTARPMPLNVSPANGAKSKVRAVVEHVFARQKVLMGLVVRDDRHRAGDREHWLPTSPNMNRTVWLDRRGLAAT